LRPLSDQLVHLVGLLVFVGDVDDAGVTCVVV
jgi:hypothetical protein